MAQLVLGTKEGYKISNLVGTTKSRREWKGLKDETALGKYLETIRSKGLDERRDKIEIEVETMPIGELDLVRVEPFSVTEGEIYNNRDEMLAKEASSLADRRGF